jgi:hypothetical protein
VASYCHIFSSMARRLGETWGTLTSFSGLTDSVNEVNVPTFPPQPHRPIIFYADRGSCCAATVYCFSNTSTVFGSS